MKQFFNYITDLCTLGLLVAMSPLTWSCHGMQAKVHSRGEASHKCGAGRRAYAGWFFRSEKVNNAAHECLVTPPGNEKCGKRFPRVRVALLRSKRGQKCYRRNSEQA